VAHPGDLWPKLVTQTPDKLPLVLSGRRNIHAAWPPDAFCEYCLTVVRQGYCGPVPAGSITYPAPHVRYICEPCVRQMLGLGPDDLAGHGCTPPCTDETHVEVVHFKGGTLETMSDEQRVATIAPHYDPKGWTVRSVAPAVAALDGNVTRWEVALVPRYLDRS
jgi:hypothetical protein